jgi:hypothetical protein
MIHHSYLVPRKKSWTLTAIGNEVGTVRVKRKFRVVDGSDIVIYLASISTVYQRSDVNVSRSSIHRAYQDVES